MCIQFIDARDIIIMVIWALKGGVVLKRLQRDSVARNILILIGILLAAVLLSMSLSGLHDDNNPFAMPVFILAVALIARLTDGYACGIVASLVGTFCVNYMFTYPFWEFDVTLTGYPLTFATMLVVSLLISALTTQVKQQEKLRFEADREKTHANLLRAISHDIRTPLASILGASSALMEQTLSDGDRATLAAAINRDANWLVRVTENLLSVTRFVGEGVALKKIDEVVEEIVGSAIVKYHRTPNALPVRVVQPETILVVPMDATLIEQVLINLFDNASAHARTATQIILRVWPEADRVFLRVEDDGAGIPSALLPLVFESGATQGARSRPDDRRSMGIGLSVCKSIVRAHGGDMTAGNNDAGGAFFQFYLPCSEEKNG